jgi:hypothetical protein
MPATAKQTPPPPATPPTPSHRFSYPDFDEVGLWLLKDLQERWPSITERNIAGWLRSLMESPEYLFIRNEKAVLLAQQTHEHLEPRPVVIEIFCVTQDSGNQDGAGLYTEMKRWAERLGAHKMIVEEFTTVPRPMIAEAIGQAVETDKVAVVRLKNVLPQ